MEGLFVLSYASNPLDQISRDGCFVRFELI